jgi:hypothetical protein
MPRVTLRAEHDEGEETLTEYVCDWPGCPNLGKHMLGSLTEIRAVAIICTEHAQMLSTMRHK